MWSLRGLQTYVNDGAIISINETHHSAIREAVKGLEEVTSWLAQNGLKTDPDKTEIISFYKKLKPHTHGSLPKVVVLRDPINGIYNIRRLMTVRYLGVYISHNLSFDHHIKVMANRTKLIVQAINILGNSI